MISAISMSAKNIFVNITGMWRRQKSVGNTTETSYYGQVRDTITLNPGDKIQMYETRAKNRKGSDPQYHLKVLRAAPDSEN
jgi:hypothetical protein